MELVNQHRESESKGRLNIPTKWFKKTSAQIVDVTDSLLVLGVDEHSYSYRIEEGRLVEFDKHRDYETFTRMKK